MPFRSGRRLIPVAVAALFMISAVAHAYGTSVMAGGMVTAPGASGMASHDTSMPCAPSDCSKDMLSHAACFAHCAVVVGIVAQSVTLSVSFARQRLDAPVIYALASVHGPPDPPPPKSNVLI
jgi:hypothetical protein